MSASPRVDGDPGRLSVYMATVFGMRVNDLRPHFFDPQSTDRERFLAWAHDQADQGRLIERFIEVAAPGADDVDPGSTSAGDRRSPSGRRPTGCGRATWWPGT